MDIPLDIKLGLLLNSYHFDRDIPGVINEQNIGAYLESDKYAGGGYKNSYGDDSLFFTRKFHTPIDNLDLFLGAVSGYEKDKRNINGFLPMAGGSYTVGNTRVTVTPDLINMGLVFPIE